MAALLSATAFGGPVFSQAPESFARLFAAARYADAERVAQERLIAIEHSVPVDQQTLADALTDLVVAVGAQGRPADAAPLITRALTIHESAGTTESPEFVRLLLAEADYWGELQAYPRMAQAANRAVAIAVKILPPDDPLRLEARKWSASGLYRAGRLEEAVAEQRDVLAAQLRVLPADALQISDSWHALGLILSTLRNYEDTIAAARRALDIREGRHDVVRAGHSANLLGSVLAEIGDYTAARPMLEKAIRYREQAGMGTSVHMARTLGALAGLLGEIGETNQATPMFQRSLAMATGTLQEQYLLAQFGNTLVDNGQTTQALGLLAPLASRLERAGEASVSSAAVFHQYAEALQQSGDLEAAERYIDLALSIRVKLALPLGVGSALSLKGVIVAARRGDREALPYFERGLTTLDKLLHDSPGTRTTRLRLAGALARSGDYPGAQRHALDAADNSRVLLRMALRSLPERQAIAYATTSRQALDLAVATLQYQAARSPAAVAAVFDRVIRARAIVLDEVSLRQQSFDAPEVRSLHQQLVDSRERLARLIVRGTVDRDVEAYALIRARAQAEAEQAEEDLAAVSARTRDARRDERIGGADAAGALQIGDAIVAYVRYQDSSSSAPIERYGAFVTSGRARAPVFVPLGPAGPIETAVAETRAELLREARSGGRSARILLNGYRRAAASLRRLVWDPVAAAVGASTRVFMVPDGALNLVSFAALPLGADRYLADDGPTLHYLAAERDLMRAERKPADGGLLAVGDARFDDKAGVPAPGGLRSADSSVPCRDFGELRFSPLPGSLNEAKAIAGLWPQASSATLLAGTAATETAIKQLAGNHRVVHLATHGFFLDGDCGGPASLLLRSGLAFAGANQRTAAGDRADDGVLTAPEIANLDLSGTEWAVLSACDTGLGSITAGEGVLGLQRAFRVAGVATVIMSLWPVEDHATRDWMVQLYRARLGDGKSTADAMREATRGVLAGRRKSGQSVHPFYWAGFVASGDWR